MIIYSLCMDTLEQTTIEQKVVTRRRILEASAIAMVSFILSQFSGTRAARAQEPVPGPPIPTPIPSPEEEPITCTPLEKIQCTSEGNIESITVRATFFSPKSDSAQNTDITTRVDLNANGVSFYTFNKIEGYRVFGLPAIKEDDVIIVAVVDRSVKGTPVILKGLSMLGRKFFKGTKFTFYTGEWNRSRRTEDLPEELKCSEEVKRFLVENRDKNILYCNFGSRNGRLLRKAIFALAMGDFPTS